MGDLRDHSLPTYDIGVGVCYSESYLHHEVQAEEFTVGASARAALAL